MITSYPSLGHIGHIVPRTPDFITFGDSSLQGAGGYSLDLKFLWYLEWPQEIQQLTMKAYEILVKNHLTGELISINLLEFATAIINYAASLAILELDPSKVSLNNPHPVLLNWSDNSTTNSWLKKTAYHSPKHRALSRILCSLRMDSMLGLNAKFVSTNDNFIADDISRLKPIDFDVSYNSIIQKYPQMRSCQIFHPSQELCSSLFTGLLVGAKVGVSRPKILGHFTAGPNII